MPKLNAATAKRVAQAESGGFDPLPEQTYLCTLNDVSTGDGPAGPLWKWEFLVVEPDEFINRKLWVNTSLTEAADWKMKEIFDAYGVSTDTHTDSLIGKPALLQVSQQVIGKGPRKGQIGNNVDKLMASDYAGPDDGGDWGDESEDF